MKRHGELFPQIIAFDNLLLAARKAFRGKRFKPKVAEYYFKLEPELLKLQEELVTESYQPRPYREFMVYEPKMRQIHAADFRDRVVHHAICNLVEPIFDRSMIFDTYACRQGKGTHAAVTRAQQFSRRYGFVLKCDVRKYFHSLDHEVLKAILARKLKDPKLLRLLDVIIDHPVPGQAPGRGIPIGNLTSQLFANLYLGQLDHFVKERLRIKGYLRYMDDSLVFGNDKPRLWLALADIREYLDQKLKLKFNDRAMRLVPVTEGVEFLGFRIYPGQVRLKSRNLNRARRWITDIRNACTPKGSSRWSNWPIPWARSRPIWPRPTLGRPGRECFNQAWRGDGIGGHEPGESWRQLEQQRQELPLSQSQQERTGQHEQQPRLPRRTSTRLWPVGLV